MKPKSPSQAQRKLTLAGDQRLPMLGITTLKCQSSTGNKMHFKISTWLWLLEMRLNARGWIIMTSLAALTLTRLKEIVNVIVPAKELTHQNLVIRQHKKAKMSLNPRTPPNKFLPRMLWLYGWYVKHWNFTYWYLGKEHTHTQSYLFPLFLKKGIKWEHRNGNELQFISM